jgi:hypothetical protein
MANTFQGITSGLATLKNFYSGPIVSQFNDEVPIYRAAEKAKESWSGQQVIKPVKVRRNPGIGATSDGGSLPSIGTQTTQQAIIAAKYNYLRFGVTGPMIKASQNDKGSFVRAVSFEMEEGLNDLKSDVNRQLSWDGTSDLAVVSTAATSSSTLVVTGRESAEDGNKFLDVGMVLDIVSATTGLVIVSGVSITAISGTTTATLTLSAPVTASANDIVIRSGSLNNEVQGLLTQLDGGTTSIFNIDRSLYPSWQGNVVNRGGLQLTLDSMQQTYNLALRRGGAKPNGIFCDFDSLRFYQKLLTADKRYVNSVKGDGSFGSKDEFYMEFMGSAVVPDKDCPQRIFFLDTSNLKKFVLAEIEWADETGSYMIAQTGADAFEVRLRLFFNLLNIKPAASAALRNYISP